MIVTLDTNVIFSALYSKTGASHQILRLILEGKIKLALSSQVYFEYCDVLTRPNNIAQLALTREEIEATLDLLALLAQNHKIYFLLRPNLVDEDDNLFYECAFASESDYLITSNVKHLSQGELKGFGFQVVTPRRFYLEWKANYV